jgi:hypothetical protein
LSRCLGLCFTLCKERTIHTNEVQCLLDYSSGIFSVMFFFLFTLALPDHSIFLRLLFRRSFSLMCFWISEMMILEAEYSGNQCFLFLCPCVPENLTS